MTQPCWGNESSIFVRLDEPVSSPFPFFFLHGSNYAYDSRSRSTSETDHRTLRQVIHVPMRSWMKTTHRCYCNAIPLSLLYNHDFFFITFCFLNAYSFPVYSGLYIIDHGFPTLLQHQGKQDQKRLSIRIIYNRERIEIILVKKYS